MNDKPPVSEGQELDVYVEAVGEKGDGIAKVKGFVLFIAGAQKGEEVKVRITKVLPKVGFAEVIGKAEKKSEAKKESKPKKEEPKIEVDEETGKEVIKGENFEAEYDPNLDSEDFGEE